MNFTKRISQLLYVTFIFMMAMAISTGYSQDSKTTTGQKTVKVKVVKEKNGKTTVLDTTFTSKGQVNQEELREMIDRLKDNMKEMESELKKMDINIAVNIDDSLDIDSLCKHQKKIIMFGNGCKNGNGHNECCPHSFKFDYDLDQDLSGLPDFQEMPDMQGFDNGYFNFGVPCLPNCGTQFNGEQEGTLKDILGNIPMERVKSYSIKDTKKGKKIVIEVENAPLFESNCKTIIMRGPSGHSRMHYNNGKKNADVKVIIRTDKDKEKEEIEEPGEKSKESKPGTETEKKEKI